MLVNQMPLVQYVVKNIKTRIKLTNKIKQTTI